MSTPNSSTTASGQVQMSSTTTLNMSTPNSSMTASSQVQISASVNQPSGIHPVGASFQVALRKFQNHLSGKDLTDFKTTTYTTLCQDIALIQHEQESLKTMMNLSRIQSCIEAMNQFGKVIEIFLNVSDIVAFIWGPIKLLLLVWSPFVVLLWRTLLKFCFRPQARLQIPLKQYWRHMNRLESTFRCYRNMNHCSIQIPTWSMPSN